MKRVSLEPDLRWHLGHIKTVSLVGNVMAAIAGATEHQADEALFVRTTRDAGGGQRELLTEGSYTNVVVVLGTGANARWLTPDDASVSILPGVTRDLLLEIEPRLQRADITRADVLSASEVLLVGTTTMVTAVSHIDGRGIAVRPGPVATELHRVLCEAIQTARD
jgi:branched-subunit amino acid aminotransferase/4-amino-4-deoxychorismate lyase